MAVEEIKYLRVLLYLIWFAFPFMTCQDLNNPTTDMTATITCGYYDFFNSRYSCVQNITYDKPHHNLVRFLGPPDDNGFISIQPLIDLNAKEKHCLTKISITMMIYDNIKTLDGNRIAVNLFSENSEELQRGSQKIDANGLDTTCTNLAAALQIGVSALAICEGSKVDQFYPNNTNDIIAVNPVTEFLHNKELSKDYPILSLTKNALKIDWGDLAKFGCDKVENENAVMGSLSFTIKMPEEDLNITASGINLDRFQSKSLKFNDTIYVDNPDDIYCNPLLVSITISHLKFGSADIQERGAIVFKDREIKPKNFNSTINGQVNYNHLKRDWYEETMERHLYLHIEAESESEFMCVNETAMIREVTTENEWKEEIILSKDGEKEINVTAYRGCQSRQIQVEIRRLINNAVVLNQTYPIPEFNISNELISGSVETDKTTKDIYFRINAINEYNLKCMQKKAVVTDMSTKQQRNETVTMVDGSHRIYLTEYRAECTDTILNIVIEDENEEEFLNQIINLTRYKPRYEKDTNSNKCSLIKKWTPWNDTTSCNATCDGGRKEQQRECLDNQNAILYETECKGDRTRKVECNMDSCRCDSTSHVFATILNDSMETLNQVKLLPDEGYLPIELDFTELKDEDLKNLVKVKLGSFAIDPFANSPFSLPCTDYRNDQCFKVTILTKMTILTKLEVNLIVPVQAIYGDGDGYTCSYKELLVGKDERLIYRKWTAWSKCSVECGDGTMTRSRDCLLGQEDYCEDISNIMEEKPCDNVEPCPGNYSSWEDWGACDKKCVISANTLGKKNRSRACIGGDCVETALQEIKDCWGSPEPNFCVPDCSLVAMEETKSKTKPLLYDMTVTMKRPPDGKWENMISQELLVRGEKYSTAQKIWILNETISDQPKDNDLIKQNYHSNEIPSTCSPCTEESQRCNCTFEGLRMHKSYSLRHILKIKSHVHSAQSSFVSTEIKCPKQIIILNDWQCKSGNQSVLHHEVCNGTPDCLDSSDEDEMMCKGESNFKYVGLPLLLCLILDIILVALLFHLNQIETRKLEIGVEQSYQLEEFWQHVWKTDQMNDQEMGRVIGNLSEDEKIKALDISTALEYTLQELIFNSFASKLGESEMLKLVATTIKNKKKRKSIIDVVKPGCIGRLKLRFLGMFSSSVITFAIFAMALVGGIFSSINSVYDPFKDITLILVFYFFKEEIIQEDFSRIDGLNLTVVVRILIACLVFSYLALTWIRIKKLPTEIVCINTGVKICCVIPGFFYVLNAYISMSISYELYQAQRRLEKLKGKEKIKEIALISHLEDKIYILEDKKRITASVKAVLEQMIQSSICGTLFLRTKLRAIFLSTITKTIPNLFEVLTIASFLTLLLKIHAYKSGCKQSFLSLGGLLQTTAMGMMLIQKVFLYILLGHQFPVLIVVILVLMVATIFVGNHLLGHHLFLKIGFPDRFIYAVASSLIPITLPEPLQLNFREEKRKSMPTNKEEIEMQSHSQKRMPSELDKVINTSSNSINMKETQPSMIKSDEQRMSNVESSKDAKELEDLDTKNGTIINIYQPRSDTGIFIHVVHFIESCLLIISILLQAHLSAEYTESIGLLFKGNTNYVYTIFLTFIFQAVGVIATIIFYRFKHPWLDVKGSGEVKEAP